MKKKKTTQYFNWTCRYVGKSGSESRSEEADSRGVPVLAAHPSGRSGPILELSGAFAHVNHFDDLELNECILGCVQLISMHRRYISNGYDKLITARLDLSLPASHSAIGSMFMMKLGRQSHNPSKAVTTAHADLAIARFSPEVVPSGWQPDTRARRFFCEAKEWNPKRTFRKIRKVLFSGKGPYPKRKRKKENEQDICREPLELKLNG